MQKATNSLAPHEWLAITVILSFLFFVSLHTYFAPAKENETELGEPLYLVSQEIEVFVEGAVMHSGSYILKRGAILQDLLEKAVPLKEANLSKVNLQRKLKNGQRITVKAKKEKRKGRLRS